MKPLQLLNNKWWRLAVCLLGFTYNFVAFYPGFLSPDSIDQYRQALAGQYTDWHPPIMSVLWHLLNNIYRGPQMMLALQLLMLWSSVYVLLNAIRNKWWYICILLFALAPFVQNFAGYIIKDSQMALSWLLACSLIFRATAQSRKLSIAEHIITVSLLLYGSIVRINALPGVIPLCVLYIWQAMKHRRAIIRIICVGIMCSGIVAAQYIANSVIKPYKSYTETKLYLHDLCGIFVYTGDNVFPQLLYQNPQFDTSYIRKHYTPATFDNIWWNPDNIQLLPPIDSLSAYTLKQAWINAIKEHPYTYVHARLNGFIYYLRIRNRIPDFYDFYHWIHPNDLGIEQKGNAISGLTVKWISLHHDMPYMKPWFWFFLNFLMLFMIRYIRSDKYRFHFRALAYSSLLYMLPSFFVYQVDTDFRYFYWNCIACSLAICLFIADRLEKSAPKAGQQST